MSFLLIKIGQSDENDVVLAHPSIAPEHAEIFVDVEGNVFLTDLNSGKDTFVNYQKLVDSIELKSIDKVTLGEGIELDWKSALAINQPKTITVGRAKSNDVIIDAPSVSENHLQLIQDQNDSYFIIDLSSEQGTYVNGTRIDEIALLKAGDVVHVGDELFLWKSIFSNSETPTKPTVENDSTLVEPIDIVEEIPFETTTTVESIIDKPIEAEPQVESIDEIEVAREKQSEIIVETPEIVEEFVITPEPIAYVVEPEVIIVPEIPKANLVVEREVIEKPIIERPVQEKPIIESPIVDRPIIDSTKTDLEKSEALARKKELIQLGVIVAVDILLIILISSII